MLSSAYKFSLFIILSILLFGATDSINIKNAFNKKNGAANTKEPAISEEDAIANAKKLVSDLNDAATGTGEFYILFDCVYYYKIVWWCMRTH